MIPQWNSVIMLKYTEIKSLQEQLNQKKRRHMSEWILQNLMEKMVTRCLYSGWLQGALSSTIKWIEQSILAINSMYLQEIRWSPGRKTPWQSPIHRCPSITVCSVWSRDTHGWRVLSFLYTLHRPMQLWPIYKTTSATGHFYGEKNP